MRAVLSSFCSGILLLASSAAFAQAMAPAAEKLVYCGRVLSNLGIESGNAADKARYLADAERLTRAGQSMLPVTPATQTQLKKLSADVDNAWDGSGSLKYDVATCDALAKGR